MQKLDCLGDMCPVPILKLKSCAAIKENGGSVMLITDHSCTVESVKGYCKGHGLTLSIEEPINGVWELSVYNTKGP